MKATILADYVSRGWRFVEGHVSHGFQGLVGDYPLMVFHRSGPVLVTPDVDPVRRSYIVLTLLYSSGS